MDNAGRMSLGVALMIGFCVLAPLQDSFAKLIGGAVAVGLVAATRFLFQAGLLLPVALVFRLAALAGAWRDGAAPSARRALAGGHGVLLYRAALHADCRCHRDLLCRAVHPDIDGRALVGRAHRPAPLYRLRRGFRGRAADHPAVVSGGGRGGLPAAGDGAVLCLLHDPDAAHGHADAPDHASGLYRAGGAGDRRAAALGIQGQRVCPARRLAGPRPGCCAFWWGWG